MKLDVGVGVCIHVRDCCTWAGRLNFCRPALSEDLASCDRGTFPRDIFVT